MKIKILLLSLMLGISTSACSGINVFVLEEKEVVVLKKGDSFVAPYSGTFYSENAEKRIMNARQIRENLK